MVDNVYWYFRVGGYPRNHMSCWDLFGCNFIMISPLCRLVDVDVFFFVVFFAILRSFLSPFLRCVSLRTCILSVRLHLAAVGKKTTFDYLKVKIGGSFFVRLFVFCLFGSIVLVCLLKKWMINHSFHSKWTFIWFEKKTLKETTSPSLVASEQGVGCSCPWLG